ncbi:MAG: hypothetical protein PHR16_11865 [Methylovulum sp.]|nr:hypothetical protein [Methylovulum sp.]
MPTEFTVKGGQNSIAHPTWLNSVIKLVTLFKEIGAHIQKNKAAPQPKIENAATITAAA